MNIRDYMKNNCLILDGSMGTLLQGKGLNVGELPERWNITHPEIISEIYRDYFDAGSNVVNTNTFGANILKFSHSELEKIIKSAIENARNGAEQSIGVQPKWVALDIGPTGKMLSPLGDLRFEDAVSVFAETVKLGIKYGADLIFIETMNDSYETKAALLAAKENSDLPVFVSNAYSEDGKLMTGADPEAMIALLEGMGADAIGMNCSFGPEKLAPVAEKYLKYSSLPIILKPNAGLPTVKNGKTVYDITSKEFAEQLKPLIKKGVTILGGCCGTTPEYIKETAALTKDIEFTPVTSKDYTLVSSYTKAVFFGNKPILIGERINPTGKKRFKEALISGDIDYILKEGISQQEKGVDILDVNVGLPEIDEEKMLKTAVCELQAVTDLPLQIDTSNLKAMKTALRIYNGKPLINSVNGKQESMDAVFPLVKKYGGAVVALTLDENGIPQTADERLEIARKIITEAEKYGIDKKDIIFDPLALTVSADNTAGLETLKAVSLIKNTLKCHTSLGVSNISFGLPCRDYINSTFFTMALSNGLSAAIMNPYSNEMLKAYYSFCALSGLDQNCNDYIKFAQEHPLQNGSAVITGKNKADISGSELQRAIIKGLKERAAELTKGLLNTVNPLKIVQNEIIPALNTVGTGFENNTVFLPQLLMSAESAKSAFEEIKSVLKTDNKSGNASFVIATVKGDIHDIGKNIVKLLLENYGFNVIDLGKDVEPQLIVNEVINRKAPLVGLSALMTTTVPAMEETIKLLRKNAPWCKIVVGGAVLTQNYADKIGADKYAKDAMDTVRYAQKIIQ